MLTNYKKYIVALLILRYVTCSPIQEIHSFNHVDFNAIAPDTLVVFDVDETLVQPTDMYVDNKNKQGMQLRNELLADHPEVKEWEALASSMLLEAERPFIEPQVISKLQILKNKGISFIACTAIKTGKYGLLPSMEQWRSEHLKSLGFEGSYADVILNLDAPVFRRHPVFYKGILATDLEQKGLVIGAFLDAMHISPKNIVMFDDNLKFLHNVQQECKKRNICFKGYLYKGAHEKPWDKEFAHRQLTYLIHHKKWLSDDAVKKIIEGS